MLGYLPAEPILDADHAILRSVAADVQLEEFSDGTLERLLGRLMGTLEQAKGVGLAAPQIGVSKRVFVMSDPQSFKEAANPVAYEDRRRRPFAPFAVINPKILRRSDEMVDHLEACLSIRGYAGIVRRHRSIEVEFSDELQNRNRLELHDYPARIFQHEHDHLDGVLFSDEGRLVQGEFIVAPEGNSYKALTLAQIQEQIADGSIEKSGIIRSAPCQRRLASELRRLLMPEQTCNGGMKRGRRSCDISSVGPQGRYQVFAHLMRFA